MDKEQALAVFENYKIRRVYDEKAEVWYFSVVDVVAALIEQTDHQTARKYWNKLKERLGKEGSESVTDCHRLKLEQKTGRSVVTGENFLPPAKAKKKLGEPNDER